MEQRDVLLLRGSKERYWRAVRCLALSVTWFYDEALFYVDVHIDKQTIQIWASENPALTVYSAYCIQSVRCAFSKVGLFGSKFIDGTVISDVYFSDE
jgi:hypothetical protein